MEEKLNIFREQRGTGDGITKEILNKYIIEVSAATRHGIEKWLNELMPMLKNTRDEEVYHIPTFEKAKETKQDTMIRNISEIEREKLIDEGYIQEIDSKYSEIREIEDPELCKLVRIIPRGNQEAEQRFWNGLENKGIIELFEQYGIHK